MNHKFVKHTLINNGGDLSTTLGSNFDIGRAKVNYRFQKVWDGDFKGVAARLIDQKLQKDF